MRTRWMCLAAVAMAAGAPGPAHAASPWLAKGRVLGADDQYVVWTAPRGGSRVLDLRTGRRVPLRSPRGCRPKAYGSGAVLFTCDAAGGWPAQPAVLELATRRLVIRSLPSALDLGNVSSGSWVAIGREWIEARIIGYHYTATVYLSRRSPYVSTGRPTPTTAPDLDAPAVMQPLCGPGTGLEGPGAVIQQRDGWAVRTARAAGGRADITLWRCGAPAIETLCRGTCGTARLYGGRVIWTDLGTTFVRRVEGGSVTRVMRTGQTAEAAWGSGGRLAATFTTADGPRVGLVALP